MEARRFWRSPLVRVGGALVVLVGIVVVMSSRANAPESLDGEESAAPASTDRGRVGSAPGETPPSVTASLAERELLDAAATPGDLTAFGLAHQERTAQVEWQVIDAYLCAEVLEAEALSRRPVVSDRYGDGDRWLMVSYVDVGDASTLDERTADYRDPRGTCNWDDPFNAAIEPFDVTLRGDPELYGFTSGEGGHWVVADGHGRGGVVRSSGIDAESIEPIAQALLANGPLAEPNE